MDKVKIGSDGHKLSLRQKIVRHLLKDAYIDELHVGAHSIVIDGDVIQMNPLASDPASPSEGWLWHLAGTTHKPRFYNGTETKDIGFGATPGAHHSEHESGGMDEINVAGLLGELADKQPPQAHGADHIGTADPISDATDTQKGLATAAQISKLNGIEAGATADSPMDAKTPPAGDVVGTTDFQTLTNKTINMPVIDKIKEATADAGIQVVKADGSTKTRLAAAEVDVGDLRFANGWRLTEHPQHGLALRSPTGKLYRLVLKEC